jgi:hypothetical protein
MHKDNKDLAERALREMKRIDNTPEVSTLKRACLGYLPNSAVKFIKTHGKTRKVSKNRVRGGLLLINKQDHNRWSPHTLQRIPQKTTSS